MEIKFEIKNMEALKEFAKFYNEYEVLDYESPNIMEKKKKEFENNWESIQRAVEHLSKLVNEADESESGSITPTTFITFQVVAHKLVTAKRHGEVTQNLKSWQDIAKLDNANEKMVGILSIFTGYK